MIKKILKYTGYFLLVTLVVIQFFHHEKNLSDDITNDITKKFPVPDSVLQILKTSCYDCHSNQTVYPWYSKIQPVDWWIQNHIDEGKDELNFSEFSKYRVYRQYHKLEKINDELEEHEMPLPSYLLIHTYAKINEEQREQLKQWTNSLRATIEANNPPDSLVNPNRRKK